MDLTFLYPIYNRAHLFRKTLVTHLEQEGRESVDYELLVVDDGSDDDILPLVKQYHATGLPLRYVRIDISRLEDFEIFKTDMGANNPAPAMNVGLKASKGEWIVLTSPEISFSKPTNLKYFKEFVDSKPPSKIGLIADVWDGDLNMFLCGGPKMRALNFLVAYNRQFLLDIGGVEENYVIGWGCEDTELFLRIARHEAEFAFDRRILGFHQWHPRAESFGRRTADVVCAANRVSELLAKHDQDVERMVANEGRDWGSDKLIEMRWP